MAYAPGILKIPGLIPPAPSDSLDQIEDRVKIMIKEDLEEDLRMAWEDKEERESKLEELKEKLEDVLDDIPSEDSNPAWYEDDPLEDFNENFTRLSLSSDSDSSELEQYYNNRYYDNDERDDSEYDSNSEEYIQKMYNDAYDEYEICEKKEEMKELQQNIERIEGELEHINTKVETIDGYFWKDIERVMDMILNSDRANNQVDPKLGTTPAIAWEYFAYGFLMQVTRCTQRRNIQVYHCGKKNDCGADVLLSKCTHGQDEVLTVVQVKLGRQFNRGEGNRIVLQLVGSCVLHGAKQGILFSSEKKYNLSSSTKDLLERLNANTQYKIKCYFIEEITEDIKYFSNKSMILQGFFHCLRRKYNK